VMMGRDRNVGKRWSISIFCEVQYPNLGIINVILFGRPQRTARALIISDGRLGRTFHRGGKFILRERRAINGNRLDAC